MTQYNTSNIKSSNSLNKLKSGIKKGTKITLKILSSVVGDSNDGIIFCIKFHKIFSKNSSANIKLSKIQLLK